MGVKGIRRKNESSPLKDRIDGWIDFATKHNLFQENKLDIEHLVASENIHIERVFLEPEISGILKKVNGTCVISVNSMHHINRQRYTIAHEFAHYCLHRDQANTFEDITFFRDNNNKTSMEYEANEFAANLLMPKQMIIDRIRAGVTSLKQLAEEFGVSILAMKYQIQKLGYGLVPTE